MPLRVKDPASREAAKNAKIGWLLADSLRSLMLLTLPPLQGDRTSKPFGFLMPLPFGQSRFAASRSSREVKYQNKEGQYTGAPGGRGTLGESFICAPVNLLGTTGYVPKRNVAETLNLR
ncbi:hypothetical protein SZ63_08535 [Methanoculleus sediminis]|uniref:Uncharacterized protein n=1 Tax=Methanoculleus sediminis TaxID=1550566 RepID=A0A0H1QYI9_9EURY|nr:hypothetical protein SZ63_08535 [Methanoculleus sediminis]